MGLKGVRTTSDYIGWDKMNMLCYDLHDDCDYMMALYINIASYTGLRMSDVLNLRWSSIIGKERLELVEKKTKKHRVITLNKRTIKLVTEIFNEYEDLNIDSFIFESSRISGQPVTKAHICDQFKRIKKKYDINVNFSSHSCRKVFGRKIWEKHGKSEASLILLMDIFNHSKLSVTKVYLGLRSDEIADVYINL